MGEGSIRQASSVDRTRRHDRDIRQLSEKGPQRGKTGAEDSNVEFDGRPAFHRHCVPHGILGGEHCMELVNPNDGDGACAGDVS